MGIIRFLYGELSHEALVQATFFSALLCFIVGVYWMVRSLKDSVFASVVGLEYQPQAKMFSLVVVPWSSSRTTRLSTSSRDTGSSP